VQHNAGTGSAVFVENASLQQHRIKWGNVGHEAALLPLLHQGQMMPINKREGAI